MVQVLFGEAAAAEFGEEVISHFAAENLPETCLSQVILQMEQRRCATSSRFLCVILFLKVGAVLCVIIAS